MSNNNADSFDPEHIEVMFVTTQYWCDDCGDAIEIGNEFFYAQLPCDIASANKGESATVCRKCDKRIEADAQNDEFRNKH